jgi:hypothetical protein
MEDTSEPCPHYRKWVVENESIQTQRWMIKDMKTHGPGGFCMKDPYDGKPLTYGETFDMHAMTMLVIAEIDAKCIYPSEE